MDKEVFVENLNKKVKMTGTWFAKHLSLPTGEEIDTGMVNMKNWWEIKGKWLDDNDRDGILAGSLFAGKNDIKLGDKLKVKGEKAEKEFTVKGIFTAGGPEDENIYSTLGSVQELSGLKNKIMKVEVSALTTPDNDLAKKAAQNPNSLTTEEYDTWFCTAYVSAICYQIQDVIRESVAKPIRKVAESEGSILNKTSLLMTLITILSSIGAALGISNLVTASVIERRMEIGLLKAIGAHNLAIVSLILLEILITSILGGILGYFTGLGLAQVIGRSVFGSGIESAPMVIPIISVVVILLALIGSIPAIKYLLRLKPTEVLHGRRTSAWQQISRNAAVSVITKKRDVSSHYDDGLFLRVGAGEPDPFLRILESDLRRAAFESEADSDDRSGFPGPVRVFSVDPSGES